MSLVRSRLASPFTRSFFSLPDLDREQSYNVKRKFPYTVSQMYDVVSRVDQYHDFIPYCEDSFIKEVNEKGQPVKAGLKVGFQSFDETFVCDLRCIENKLVIAESITHSLFHTLYTEWNFSPLNTRHCAVDLTLRYRFKNELYNQVSSLFADKVTKLMIRAFEKRAWEQNKKALE